MKEHATIRPYNNQDKQAVIDLLRLNTPAYFSPEEETDLIFYLDNELEAYFVLEVDNKVVGSGGFNFSGDPAHGKISWDLFHPDFQGKGLGRMLLHYRIEKLKACEGLETITVRTSQMVYQFYEKSGFQLVETVKDFWAQGYDMYQMIYVHFDGLSERV